MREDDDEKLQRAPCEGTQGAAGIGDHERDDDSADQRDRRALREVLLIFGKSCR